MVKFILAFVLASGLAYGVTEWNQVDFKDLITVDNLQLDGNTVSSTDTNGDINLEPDGTGQTVSTKTIKAAELNIGGTNDASSLFDVTSTTKGTRPFPSMTTAQRDAISTPATGLILFNTDTNQLNQYDGTQWGAVAGSGGSGVKNYLSEENSKFDSGVGDWATFDDASAYVDGTGGTAANLTLSVTSTSGEFLEGTQSASLAKAAADAQYEGVSVSTETIDPLDYGNELFGTINIDSNDANYANGDLRLFAYDVTNGEILTITCSFDVDCDIPVSDGTDKLGFKVFLDGTTGAQTAQVRLSLMVNSTNATAWEVFYDDVKLGPEGFGTGFITKDVEAYTPALNSTSNVSINEAVWYRRGRYMYIEGYLKWSAAGSGVLELDIPSGYTIDTDYLFDSADTIENNRGYFHYYDSADAANRTDGAVVYYSSNSVRFLQTSNSSYFTQTTPSANDRLGYYFKVPIVGWEDSTLISTNEQFFKNAGARYTTNAGQSIPNATVTVVDFEDLDFDEANLVTTGSSWKFVAQKSGKYLIDSMISFVSSGAWTTSGEEAQLRVYITNSSGTSFVTLDRKTPDSTNADQAVNLGKSVLLKLQKDDEINIRVTQSSGGALTLETDTELNYVAIAPYPDTTNSGTIDNMSSFGPYDLSVTGTNWTTEKAVATFERVNATWFMDFVISGTISSTTTSIDLSIANVTVDTDYTRQALTAVGALATTSVANAWFRGATNTIEFRGSTTTTLYITGRVQLANTPSIITN